MTPHKSQLHSRVRAKPHDEEGPFNFKHNSRGNNIFSRDLEVVHSSAEKNMYRDRSAQFISAQPQAQPPGEGSISASLIQPQPARLHGISLATFEVQRFLLYNDACAINQTLKCCDEHALLITKFWCEVYGRLEIFQPTCRYCFGFAVSSYNHLQPFS